MQYRFLTLMSIMASVALVLVVSGRTANAAPFSRLNETASTTAGLVQKIHGRHCRMRYGRSRHWHGGYGHVHRRWHRHGRCFRYRSYHRRRYYGPYYRAYIGPRFYGYRRYRYRRFYRPRFRRGVSIRLHF